MTHLLATTGIWTFAKMHPGIILVVIGVIGEIVSAWKRSVTKREAWEQFFGVVLIAGLVMEIGEAVKQDRQVGDLQSTTAKVEMTNGWIWQSNSLLWQTNLVLRSNVAELELNAAPRHITAQQTSDFIKALNGPQGGVKMGFADKGHETRAYAYEIRRLIETNGFSILSDQYYPDYLLTPNPGDSIMMIFNSFTNPPPQAHTLSEAFAAAKIPFDYISQDVPTSQFGLGEKPGSNEILLLVTEKP